MDFDALNKRMREQTYKVHGLYQCNVCGDVTRYVMLMPHHMQRHYPLGRRCRGHERLIAKIFVPKGHPNY